MVENIHVHLPPRSAASAEFKKMLSRRRERLASELAKGEAKSRYFPVLCVLAPVMTQSEGEITYPGDPMCLYGALSVVVRRAVDDSGPLELAKHYNDLAPRWTRLPDMAYRLAVRHDGFRPYGEDPNTDQSVFDPRVWNEEARARWIMLLREVRPRVILISSVSPAHRYALDIAALARIEVPGAYVILGGRHVDETLTYLAATGTVRVEPSSTLAVIDDGRAPRVVDATISGDAYFSLDLLMRAVALAADLDGHWVDPAKVRHCLDNLARLDGPVPGRSLIALVSDDEVHVYPQHGEAIDFDALPSPYEGFAIRSRFPIFTAASTGEIQRTAHAMVSNSCPYHCNFCSEAARLTGGLKRFGKVATGLHRVCEYIGYGAEALFFDDSIFWSGNFPDALEFCGRLTRLRAASDGELFDRLAPVFRAEDDVARLRTLQWGAQYTVDVLVALHNERKSAGVLAAMREAGCTYVYIGIESMAAEVMSGIHKNLRRGERSWADKVRAAATLVKSQGLRVGTSVLFGLDGETRDSIDETINAVAALIDDELIDLASPNVLTYHPATPITQLHGMREKLDYHSPHLGNRKPYVYFEEAFPGVVSIVLREDDLWHIHHATKARWGRARNDCAPVPLQYGENTA